MTPFDLLTPSHFATSSVSIALHLTGVLGADAGQIAALSTTPPAHLIPPQATDLHSLEAGRDAAVQPIPAVCLPHFKDVQMVMSKGALDGWVEQASPACGAASVAGAWNAIKPSGDILPSLMFVSFVLCSRTYYV